MIKDLTDGQFMQSKAGFFYTHLNVTEHARIVQRFIFSLHVSGIQSISTVHELHNVPNWISYCQVILRGEIFQRLKICPKRELLFF